MWDTTTVEGIVEDVGFLGGAWIGGAGDEKTEAIEVEVGGAVVNGEEEGVLGARARPEGYAVEAGGGDFGGVPVEFCYPDWRSESCELLGFGEVGGGGGAFENCDGVGVAHANRGLVFAEVHLRYCRREEEGLFQRIAAEIRVIHPNTEQTISPSRYHYTVVYIFVP